MIASDEGRPVDGAQIWAKIDKCDVGIVVEACISNQPCERRCNTKCALFAGQTAWPCCRQFVFDLRERQIADQQSEAIGPLVDVRIGCDIPYAAKQRRYRTIDRLFFLTLKNVPETVFVQEHCAQIGLWIQIDREHPMPEPLEHPRQVVDKRRLADASLIIEEGNSFHWTPCTPPPLYRVDKDDHV